MDVVSPDGRPWTVRRRWLPAYAAKARDRWRWKRIRDRAGNVGELADVPADGCFDVVETPAIVLVVLGIVLLLVAGFIAVPLLVDALIVLLAVLLGGAFRTLFRRPWTVEAISGEERRTRLVVGWRAAGRAAEAWAEELRHGRGQ